jgi:hypothetical protein
VIFSTKESLVLYSIKLLSYDLSRGTLELEYKNPSDPITSEEECKEKRTKLATACPKLWPRKLVIFVIETLVS